MPKRPVESGAARAAALPAARGERTSAHRIGL